MAPIVGSIYQTNLTLDSGAVTFSVFDCEPAGLLVVAKTEAGPEYTLSPSKQDLQRANISKTVEGCKKLVDSMRIIKNAQGNMELISSLEGVSRNPPSATSAAATAYLKAAPAGKETLPDLLASGLTELCREKPVGLQAVEWLGNWLLANNPNQPRVS